MKKIYPMIRNGLMAFVCLLLTLPAVAQDCSSLQFTYTTSESRCTATGSVQVNVTGGSGNYNYKVTGPVSTSFTSSNIITGLSAGNYTAIVKDISSGCIVQRSNVMISGFYSDPRFVLAKTDVTCINGNDGTVTVNSPQYGRQPFSYTIMAPSPSGAGISNTTGIFTNLTAGEYVIQLKDSCGGQQTRRITVLNYSWWIDGATINRVLCDSADVAIHIKDSKGNTTGSIFNGFQYAVVRAAGDTIWSNSTNFRFLLGNKRSVTIVIKDPCGNIQTFAWSDPNTPAIAAAVTISDKTCATFAATIAGQTHLINPQYYLYNSSNALLSNNATGTFTGLSYGAYCIRVQDGCYDTTIVRCFTVSQPVPVVSATVTISTKNCSSFTATITGQNNLTNPVYNIYNSNNVHVAGNSTGVFTGLPYGSYCIDITNNSCYDTTINRCFTVAPDLPSVGGTVSAAALGCSTFTATITGQTNLSNPQFCLYDANDNIVTCNGTGVFTNVPYGTYCIKMQNDAGCYDTLITRCFTTNRPVPGVGATVNITARTCSTFTASIAGATNLNNPNYCLYDANDVQITCNNTGIFPGLSYGYYCIKVQNDAGCYDTLIIRCFDVTRPIPSVGASITIGNKACSTVTASVVSQLNLTSAVFNLLDAGNNIIATNGTGVFTNVAYGAYCIEVVNTCYDTTIRRCFTATRNRPTGGNVTVSNKACSTFTATVTGQTNLITPQYTLYDTGNNPVATSTNGIFNNVPYGTYSIHIYDPCYDTTIIRTVTGTPNPMAVTIAAVKSCTIGTTDVTVTIGSGSAPYRIEIYGPFGHLLRTVTSPVSPVSMSGIPGLPGGLQYKIKAIDNCNVADSSFVTPIVSTLTKTRNATTKCPTAQWENGATDIDIDVTSNMGVVTPAIVNKNGVTVNMNYSHNVGNNYKFIDLEPATYVVAYTIPGCSDKVYDTVVVEPYGFPGLQRSAAYQCNNNSFSVGASVTGGCSPFTYEVIGSIPGSPSLISTGQLNPVFNINNGTEYSLIRLRAVDACGNATLNDVNILPLANTIVNASSNCFYNNINLQVDTIPNATYQWYLKSNAGDSTLVGNGDAFNIPYLMPADTGIYVCKISVNGGCLTQLSYFNLNGMCDGLLAPLVHLTGKAAGNKVQLSWAVSHENDTKEYIIERSNSRNGQYTMVGIVQPHSSGSSLYVFMDNNPLSGANYYRLKMTGAGNRFSYTNIILARISSGASVSLYPNPVKEVLHINIAGKEKQTYRVVLYNAAGQVVYENKTNAVQQAVINYQRNGKVKAGMYLLQVTAVESGEMHAYKVVFE
jgi:hypothetical protein